MHYKFSKHYTRDEARALLPKIRQWLEDIVRVREQVVRLDKRLTSMLGTGDDIGGESVNEMVRRWTDLKMLLQNFTIRDIQIKDLDRGLIDFPAVVNGKEVFLCWEKDEDDIEFWHDLDTGFGGRERL
jgi:hypothetical protein